MDYGHSASQNMELNAIRYTMSVLRVTGDKCFCLGYSQFCHYLYSH